MISFNYQKVDPSNKIDLTNLFKYQSRNLLVYCDSTISVAVKKKKKGVKIFTLSPANTESVRKGPSRVSFSISKPVVFDTSFGNQFS